ncbi:MAG TPA: sialidase family protein [Polyangiaceae bacterium]|nr:sialidase family protein [Polyangiaceae bacterium]
MRRGIGVLGALLVVGNAHAHGGFPRAQRILVEPGNPAHVVVGTDFAGFFSTTDGGQTWQYVCAEAYGMDSLSAASTPLGLPAGGPLLIVAGFHGLDRMSDVCDVATVAFGAAAGNQYVMDVGPLPPDAEGFMASPLNTQTPSLWRFGTDTPVARLPDGVLASSFFAATRDIRYVAGARLGDGGTARIVFFASTDGGAHWLETPVPVAPSAAPRIVGVDPRTPNRVFLTTTEPVEIGSTSLATLWVSENAGQSWTERYSSPDALPGFAVSPDGTSFVFGGPSAHLLGMTFTDATSPDVPPHLVSDRRVWGLTWTEDALYAGTDEFGPAGSKDVTVSVSHDGGRTFAPFFSICDLKAPACPAGSTVAAQCDGAFQNLTVDILSSQRCADHRARAAESGDGSLPTVAPGGGSSTSDAGQPTNADRPLRIVAGCSLGARRAPRGSLVEWLIGAAFVFARGRDRRGRRS